LSNQGTGVSHNLDAYRCGAEEKPLRQRQVHAQRQLAGRTGPPWRLGRTLSGEIGEERPRKILGRQPKTAGDRSEYVGGWRSSLRRLEEHRSADAPGEAAGGALRRPQPRQHVGRHSFLFFRRRRRERLAQPLHQLPLGPSGAAGAFVEESAQPQVVALAQEARQEIVAGDATGKERFWEQGPRASCALAGPPGSRA